MKTYIYFLINNLNECVYIGKTGNLKARISQHFKRRAFNECVFIEINNTMIANLMEMYYIARYNPLENIEFKDIGWTIKIDYFENILRNNAYLFRFHGKHEKIDKLNLKERERADEELFQNVYTYKVYKRIDSNDKYLKKEFMLTEIGICDNIDVQYNKLIKKIKQGKIKYDFKLTYCNHLDKVSAEYEHVLLSLEYVKDSRNKHVKGIKEYIGEYISPSVLIGENSRYHEFVRYREYAPKTFCLNCEISDEEILKSILGKGEFCEDGKTSFISYDSLISECLKKNISRYKPNGFTYVVALLDKNNVVLDFNIENINQDNSTDEHIIELLKYRIGWHFDKYLFLKGLPNFYEGYAEVVRALPDVIEEENKDNMSKYYLNCEIFFIKNDDELRDVKSVLHRLLVEQILIRDAIYDCYGMKRVKSVKSKKELYCKR